MVDVFTAGAAAGLAASVVMTLLMIPILRGRPGANEAMAARFTGKSPEESRLGGTALHYVYGIFWGVMFAWGLDAWFGIEGLGAFALVGAGLALGMALFLASAFFWAPALGLDRSLEAMPRGQRRQMRAEFLGAHLACGAVLGLSILELPVTSSAPRLGNVVPAAGLAMLVLVLLAGLGVRVERAESPGDRKLRQRKQQPASRRRAHE